MDREKVIKGLECHQIDKDHRINCSDCPYHCDEFMNGLNELHNDALELLKEQQQRIEQLEIDRDILVKDINTNNCNTCKRECEYRPIPGNVVRVNCFMWEGR